MIKGISRRVIVVKSPDRRFFEEAIFIVREGIIGSGGVTADQVVEEARRVVYRALEDCADHRVRDWADMKQCVKDELSKFLYKKTQRNPMILPIIMEV